MALEKILNKVKKGLAIGVLGLASLLPTAQAKGEVISTTVRPENIYVLAPPNVSGTHSAYFYTDIKEGTTNFDLKIWDGDPTLRIEVYNPNGDVIYAQKHIFSNEKEDILSISTESAGTYKIKIEQVDNLPSQVYGNAFGVDINFDNLYSAYPIPFDEQSSPAKGWIKKPSGFDNFSLWNYDMDSHGKIKIYRPDGSLYNTYSGSQYVSGNEEWKYITIPTSENEEYWRTEFSDLDGTRQFLVMSMSSKDFFSHSNDIYLNPIPEPSTLALLGAGALGLAGLKVRRKR